MITIADIYPKVAEKFTTTHIIYLSPTFAAPVQTFWGIKPLQKDLVSVTIKVNDRAVEWLKAPKACHRHPNEMYLNIGTHWNRNGLYIEIPNEVWAEIIGSRKIELEIEVMLHPDKTPKEREDILCNSHQAKLHSKNRIDEFKPVSHMIIKIRGDIEGDGLHLLMPSGQTRGLSVFTGKPIGFNSEWAYEHFHDNFDISQAYEGIDGHGFICCPREFNPKEDVLLWQTVHTYNSLFKALDLFPEPTENDIIFTVAPEGYKHYAPLKTFHKDRPERSFEISGIVSLEKVVEELH